MRIPTLVLTLASLIFLGIFTQSCSNEELFDNRSFDIESKISSSEMGIDDFKNWFNSQQIEIGFVEKDRIDWDNAEIKLMPDGKSTKVSFAIYQCKNSSGNDSIRELHIAYVRNIFMGGVMAFSFNSKKRAYVEQYDLKGQLEREWMYYAPKQVFSLLKIYPNGASQVRLKLRSEDEGCPGETEKPNSATPSTIDGNPNSEAYNCHYYVWGPYQETGDPLFDEACIEPGYPKWNNWPIIAGSGWSEVSTPQVGDRWVSFTDDIVNGENLPWHSAKIIEVTNGKVTKVEAKCGYGGIWTYDPECDKYVGYTTNMLKYYREQ